MSNDLKDTETTIQVAPVTAAFPPIAQNFIPELLSEIFIACHPDNMMPMIRRNESPLSVSHVCRAWRNTALSTCKLWSGVHIVCKDDDYILDIGPALRQWFKRSGSADIALRIELPQAAVSSGDQRGTSKASWPAIETLFQEATEHSERLTSLSIFLNAAYLREVSSFIQENFHSLKRFKLHVSSLGHHWLDPTHISHFSGVFSRLSELDLYLRFMENGLVETHAFQLPLCPYLRKLHMDFSVTPGQFVSALEKCPSVEEVVLRHRPPFRVFGAAEPQLPVPQRKIFGFIHTCTISSPALKPAYITTILRASQMPSLSHLTIDILSENMLVGSGNDGNELYLEDFLVRSSPPLESLYIEGLPVSPNSVARCLRLSPLLRRLHVTMTEHLARTLTLPAQMPECDTLVCPLLEELEIVYPPLDVQDAQALFSALADMVHSRWHLSCDRKTSLAKIAPSKAPKAQVPKVLRRLTIPSYDVKRHPLYKGIRDCIRRGFVLNSSK